MTTYDALTLIGNALAGMDRAGGDRDGMPECPWCRRQESGTEDESVTSQHDADCELVAARNALDFLLSKEPTP